MLIVNILVFFSIIIGLISFATKKVKFQNSALLIIILTILPIVIYWMFYEFICTLTIGFSKDDLDVKHLIALMLFFIEFSVISIFLAIRYNVNPKSKLPSDFDNNLILIDKARKLLFWGMYSNIINTIITVLIILSVMTFSLLFLVIPGGIIFLVPFDAFLGLIISICSAIIFAITYAFTINGTIRFLLKSKISKVYIVYYSIMMLIPIANIITSIILIVKARKMLKVARVTNSIQAQI